MTGAAKPRTRIGKRIKDEGEKSKELYSLFRRSDTPTQIQPSFSAGSSAGTNRGDVNFLPTGGGTMVGAIAFYPKLITIASGVIDISKGTDEYTSRVIVSPESGNTDNLDTITGAANAGQLLFLQGVQTNTITVTNSGNIETIDGADFSLADDDILVFMFDTTDNKWQQVTTGKQGVLSAGTFISASLSSDQTSNIAATDHIEFDTTDSGTIVLQTGAGQADGIFELKSGKTYVLNGNLRPLFTDPTNDTGQLVVAWYDITNTAELGKRAIYDAQQSATDGSNQPSATYIVTPASDITVELRIISVTALSALENEYCNAIIFEVGAGGGGGGGSVSFPITPTINDHGNVGTTTEDIDLSLSTGHVHKITLTGDPTLTFSNPPSSGTQIEFEIEFVQDATGGRTVTYPASVVETVTISSVANTTTIVTFRTNDGGTNYHAVPALRGTISLTGGNVYAAKALDNLVNPTINTDLDFNSYDAKNMDRIEFAASSGAVSTAATPTIYLDASGDMVHNVADTDQHYWTINDITILQLYQSTNDSVLTIKAVDDGTPILQIYRADSTPSAGASVGRIEFLGVDSGGSSQEEYGRIRVDAEELTGGAVDGSIHLAPTVASSPVTFLSLNNSNDGLISVWKNIKMQTGIDIEMDGNDIIFDSSGTNIINADSGGIDIIASGSGDTVAIKADSQTYAFSSTGLQLGTIADKDLSLRALQLTGTTASFLVDGAIFYNSTANKFQVRENGSTVDMISGSQTPWASNIDAASYELNNVSRIDTSNFYNFPCCNFYAFSCKLYLSLCVSKMCHCDSFHSCTINYQIPQQSHS